MKVANASTVSGAAASLTEQLAAFHFAVGDATNAAGPDERLDVSKVYYLPGSEAVAGQIAALMGDVAVVPMPTPAWIREGTAGLKDATVLVMLGTDLAGKKALPGLRGRRPG